MYVEDQVQEFHVQIEICHKVSCQQGSSVALCELNAQLLFEWRRGASIKGSIDTHGSRRDPHAAPMQTCLPVYCMLSNHIAVLGVKG